MKNFRIFEVCTLNLHKKNKTYVFGLMFDYNKERVKVTAQEKNWML